MNIQLSGHRHILDVDIELDVTDCLSTVLFGPSGAGKTTLLRVLAGLEPLDAGELRVDGELWTHGAKTIVPARKRHVGLLFQDHALFPHMSVEKNVEYGVPRHLRSDKQDIVQWALRQTRAESLVDRPVTALSGGEAQRVAFARALARQPKMLLLDEPLSALDAPTREVLRNDLRSLIHTSGIPTISVTHDRTEALILADQVVVLINGRIHQIAGPTTVFEQPADAQVAGAVGVETASVGNIVGRRGGLVEVEVDGTRVFAPEPNFSGNTVLVCVRAEDIALTQEKTISSQRNQLSGHVARISPHGPLIRIDIDAGWKLASFITRTAMDELGLQEGSPVVAAFKAQSVHVIPHN
jgi:molybdate transport system ATP-binding protein